MEQFAAYGHAIVAMAGTAVFGLVIGPLSAMRKTSAGLAPGAEPKPDYSTSVYRWHRAYSNLSEVMGYFVACTVAAILAGTSPFWVNLFASIFFASRVVLACVHIGGVGKPDMGVRSIVFVAGFLMCVLLAIMAVVSVF